MKVVLQNTYKYVYAILMISISIAICQIANAQEAQDYVVDPTTKTYTKFGNPLIKTEPIEVLVVNGQAYLQGDIYVGSTADLDRLQQLVPGLAVTQDNGRWENGIVPFEILDGFTAAERQPIFSAMNHYAENTHVCFRRRTNEIHHVKFKKVTKDELGFSGGRSALGRVFITVDGQEILLTRVNLGLVIHEIGHALGLFHEQSREDRDTFVEILWNNIQSPHQGNFSKKIFNATDVGSYDFKSIMHYGSKTFGKKVNGRRLQTIRRLNNPSDTSFGQRDGLSSGDIRGINSMYPTEQHCSTLSDFTPGELNVGQSKTVNIRAREPHNLTGIFMRSGQKFQFSTRSPAWDNGTKHTTCDGYSGSILDAARRHPDIGMMTLTGEIFKQNNKEHYTGTYFTIGCSRTLVATKSGYLIGFANDTLVGGYGDNSRIVELTVKRTE